MAPLSEADKRQVSIFVDEMRAARLQRGWTQADLAGHANYSESAIAMVETYQRTPTAQLAKALDRAFETAGFTEGDKDSPGTPGTFMRLWRKLRTLPFPVSFRAYVEREETATALRTVRHSIFPGLVQTEAYMRAVFATNSDATEADIDSWVQVRLARQQILTRAEPPSPWVWILLEEGLLYRPVGSATTMRDQLMHVIAISELPRVSIQVVPYSAGGHSGLNGAFTIADFTGQESTVWLEDVISGRLAEDPAAVSYVTMLFEALRSDALPKVTSRDLIAKVNEELWTT